VRAVRWLVLLAACAKQPDRAPPPPPPDPEVAPAPAPGPAVPACEEPSLRECSADVEMLDAGPSLTLKLTESATQGTDPGKTFDEPYWDCDVFVIGVGRFVEATHHRDDLHVELAPGRYVVWLDSCFGCRKNVPITITRGHSALVNARCHVTGA